LARGEKSGARSIEKIVEGFGFLWGCRELVSGKANDFGAQIVGVAEGYLGLLSQENSVRDMFSY
jgi:hypothetical protein